MGWGKAGVICNLQIGKPRLGEGHKPELYPLCSLVSLSVGTVTEHTITLLTQVEQARGYAGMQWRESSRGRKQEEASRSWWRRETLRRELSKTLHLTYFAFFRTQLRYSLFIYLCASLCYSTCYPAWKKSIWQGAPWAGIMSFIWAPVLGIVAWWVFVDEQMNEGDGNEHSECAWGDVDNGGHESSAQHAWGHWGESVVLTLKEILV